MKRIRNPPHTREHMSCHDYNSFCVKFCGLISRLQADPDSDSVSPGVNFLIANGNDVVGFMFFMSDDSIRDFSRHAALVACASSLSMNLPVLRTTKPC